MKTEKKNETNITKEQLIHRLLIIIVGAGGTGKSFLARFLAGWLRAMCEDLGLGLKLFDADEISKKDLARFYPNDVVTVDIGSREKLANFLTGVITPENAAQVSLVDCAGDVQSAISSTQIISPWVAEKLESRHNTKIVVVVPIVAGKPSSMAVVPDWFALFGSAVQYVLVRNGRDGDFGDFPKIFEEWRQAIHPAEITLPALPSEIARELEIKRSTMHELAAIADLPTSAQIERDYGYLSTIFALGPVEEFMREVTPQLEAVFADLLPKRS